MNEISKRIIRYRNSETISKLNEFYSKKSLMEIYGVNRKEIRHTSFLKWLFSPTNEVSKVAVERLLQIIINNRFFDKEKISEELYTSLVLGKFERFLYKVTENYHFQNKSNRGEIDLLIEVDINNSPIKIVLENKVDSNENDNQTIKYYNYFKDNTETIFFVYLTPISTIELEKLEEVECKSKEFIQINYQSIVDEIIEPILNTTKNTDIKYILNDYLIALSNSNQEQKTKFNFMAISEYENELLQKFWEENKDLVLKAIEASKENYHLEPEIRKEAEEISDFVNNKKEKIGAYVKRKFKEIVNQAKLEENEVSNLQNKEYCKKTLGINYPFLREFDDSKPQRYWKEFIEINNQKYYMCCEWIEKYRQQFDNWLNQYS